MNKMKKIFLFISILSLFNNVNSMENQNKEPIAEEQNLGTLAILPNEVIGKIIRLYLMDKINDWDDIFNFDKESLKAELDKLHLICKDFIVFEVEELKNFVKKLKNDRFECLKNRIKQEYSHLSKEELDKKLKTIHVKPEMGKLDEKDAKEAIKLCIAGADLNLQSYLTPTILNYAIDKNYIEIIKLLMVKGVDVNLKDYFDFTPLISASRNGNIEIIKLLVDNNADVNFKNWHDCTALTYAIIKGHTEAVMLLIANGATIKFSNEDIDRMLISTAEKGCTELVRLLIANGANIKNINTQDSCGWTPLMRAARNGHLQTAQLLLNNDADIDIQDPSRGTALMQAAKNGHIEMVKLLLNKDADVNIQRNDGLTALDLAIKNDHTEIVELLKSKCK